MADLPTALADIPHRFAPAGDGALMLYVEDAGIPVPALAEAISALGNVQETVPALSSVMIRFDPLVNDHAAVQRDVERLNPASLETGGAARVCWQLPVCYDADFGPDLALVAEAAGLSAEAVIEAHQAATFTVGMLGFMPGFGYLTGAPEALCQPRLTTPRTIVPAGSVAIADGFTAVYPFESPGGWRLLGRTPVQLFDPQREPPILFGPGDEVRFTAISREEFDRLRADPPRPDDLLA